MSTPMTSEEAAAIRLDLANVYQGLMAQQETLEMVVAIVTAIHEACSKDPPPSKVPAALADLTAAVVALRSSPAG